MDHYKTISSDTQPYLLIQGQTNYYRVYLVNKLKKNVTFKVTNLFIFRTFISSITHIKDNTFEKSTKPAKINPELEKKSFSKTFYF